MWLIVEWQFAQMTARRVLEVDAARRRCRCVAIESERPHAGVRRAPPTSVGVAETSAGNFVQTNVSCTQRTRRNAKFEKNCFITPGFVSTPACRAAVARSRPA